MKQEVAFAMLKLGFPWVSYLNDQLRKDPKLKAFDYKVMAIIAVCYAASMARLTDLDAEDFLGLSLVAYQNINAEIAGPAEEEEAEEAPKDEEKVN